MAWRVAGSIFIQPPINHGGNDRKLPRRITDRPPDRPAITTRRNSSPLSHCSYIISNANLGCPTSNSNRLRSMETVAAAQFGPDLTERAPGGGPARGRCTPCNARWSLGREFNSGTNSDLLTRYCWSDDDDVKTRHCGFAVDQCSRRERLVEKESVNPDQ